LEHGIHAYALKTIKTLGKVNAVGKLNNSVNKPFIVKSSFENEMAIFLNWTISSIDVSTSLGCIYLQYAMPSYVVSKNLNLLNYLRIQNLNGQ